MTKELKSNLITLIVPVLAIVMAWGVMQAKISRLEIDVKANTQWQKDWTTGGRLPADVEQDKEIEFLNKRMDTFESMNLESRLVTIETILLEIREDLKKR